MFLRAALILVSTSVLAAEAERVATITDAEIKECSGIVASRTYPGVFWTHNDGKKERLFAIDRKGGTVGQFKVTGAKFEDWEDIALDSANNLYVADTGNNEGQRGQVAVYRFAEPNPKSEGKSVAIEKQWLLRYPSEPFDCESILIVGTNGYLISKVKNDRLAEVYRFSLGDSQVGEMLQAITRLGIDSPVTAAAISPDGKRLAAISKLGAYLFDFESGFASGGIMRPARHVRFRHESIEACTFVPEGLLVAAESREIFLFRIP